MKKIIFISILLVSLYIYPQKQTAHWYFGDLAAIDFNSGSPIPLTDSLMNTDEGCATISDPNGNLLFYTNGVSVWNRNHEVMTNGTDLNGHPSSTNSAIIIPKPLNINNYYIFTVDDLAGTKGLQYSEVDMTLNGGLGDIINTNKNTVLHSPTTEKITAVKHQNDVDWWVLTHEWGNNNFVAYKVTSTGVQNGIVSAQGITINGDTYNSVGTMKFSPNGEKIAIANSYDNNSVQLLDFNDLTGEVNNPTTLTGYNGSSGVYGVEFSPNSKILYVSDTGGNLYQYNLDLPTESDIINSKTLIQNGVTGIGALQIAPDGKIYAAKLNRNKLPVIKNPNIFGIGCNFEDDYLDLAGRRSKLGLPPFIQSFFWKAVIVENDCFGENTQFTLVDPEVSQVWDFGDPASGVNNSSTDVNPTHVFSSPGTYPVKVDVTNFLGETSTTILNVTISEIPIASQPTDYIECDNNTDGDDNNGVIQSFLLSTKDSEILGSLDPSQYDVFYFEDSSFNQKINKTLAYENSNAHSQTVYAKIFNKQNDNCYDEVQFNLIVNPIPQFDLTEEKIICANNLPDSLAPENALGNYYYQWIREDGSVFFNGETLIFNDVSSISDAGLSLTLTATDLTNNCTNSKNVLIRKIVPAVFTQNDIIINDLSENNTVTINPQDPNFIISDYLFALGDVSITSEFQNNLVFENVVPGIKTLYIKDIYDCNTTTLELSILGFPKFFTPNNDGFNDTWHILGVNQSFYSASVIKIFDRFGKIITTVSPSSEGWNGFYGGKELPETDYWFTVELINSDGETRNYKGHFSLIRR